MFWRTTINTYWKNVKKGLELQYNVNSFPMAPWVQNTWIHIHYQSKVLWFFFIFTTIYIVDSHQRHQNYEWTHMKLRRKQKSCNDTVNKLFQKCFTNSAEHCPPEPPQSHAHQSQSLHIMATCAPEPITAELKPTTNTASFGHPWKSYFTSHFFIGIHFSYGHCTSIFNSSK